MNPHCHGDPGAEPPARSTASLEQAVAASRAYRGDLSRFRAWRAQEA